MADIKKFSLQPEVAAKYDCPENFLPGGKLVFPFPKKHNVANKPAHELTLAEVDKLVAANAVNGVFTLKTVAAPVAGSVTVSK